MNAEIFSLLMCFEYYYANKSMWNALLHIVYTFYNLRTSL